MKLADLRQNAKEGVVPDKKLFDDEVTDICRYGYCTKAARWVTRAGLRCFKHVNTLCCEVGCEETSGLKYEDNECWCEEHYGSSPK